MRRAKALILCGYAGGGLVGIGGSVFASEPLLGIAMGAVGVACLWFAMNASDKPLSPPETTKEDG